MSAIARAVSVAMPDWMWKLIASISHATKLVNIRSMYMKGIEQRGRSGSMYAGFPHFDPRSKAQQRWKSDWDTIVHLLIDDIKKDFAEDVCLAANGVLTIQQATITRH